MISTMLSRGSRGPDVEELQTALLYSGFSPGAIDGWFGSGTRAAVIAFQNSEGLLADGIAGPRTLFALGLAKSSDLADATGQLTVDVVSQMCPYAPFAHIQRCLPGLIGSHKKYKLVDKTMLLMSIATINAETGTFLPISEYLSQYNTSPDGPPFGLWDNRKDLGNLGPDDGAMFKGRGFIQLTGRYNYTLYGPKLNPPVDLVSNPEAANDVDTAADLLCLFLADREIQIKDALANGNMQVARRLVNGGTNGLAAFESAYLIGDGLLT
jgi:putative chitinase